MNNDWFCKYWLMINSEIVASLIFSCFYFSFRFLFTKMLVTCGVYMEETISTRLASMCVKLFKLFGEIQSYWSFASVPKTNKRSIYRIQQRKITLIKSHQFGTKKQLEKMLLICPFILCRLRSKLFVCFGNFVKFAIA